MGERIEQLHFERDSKKATDYETKRKHIRIISAQILETLTP